MDKKELSVTILVVGLTILFTTASLALFLSGGKSKFWTAKKMKFGAILLTLTAAASLSSCDGGDGEVMCYSTAQLENWVNIENFSDTIDLNKVSELKGVIEYRMSDTYSFLLKNDNDSTIVRHELLSANDGAFNDSTELFTIKLDSSLTEGKYTLSIYDTPVDSVDYSLADFHFNIKND